MLALLRALAVFGLLFVFHTVPLLSQAAAPDVQAFAAMSNAERSAYIFQLNLELRDTTTFLQEYHALLDIARKAGDHRAAWALDFEFFQQRPDFKWPQELRLSSAEKLYKTAHEAGWDVEEIVALHYLQFEKYNYKLIPHEKLYAHILTEFERMKSVGLEQFKYFEPARILFHDARFMYELDDLEKALNILTSVEPFCKPDDRGLQTWIFNTNLVSSTYQQLEKYEEGIIYAKKILEVSSHCPSERPPQLNLCRVWQSIATVDIANMLVKQGKMAEGEIYADKGYAYLQGDFERQAIFDALLVLAPTKLSLGKIEESGQLLKRMEEILNEVPAEQQDYFYFKKVRFYETYAQYQAITGNLKAAYHFTSLAKPIKDSLEHRNDARKLEKIHLRHEAEKYHEQLQMVERERELQRWLRNAALLILLLVTALGYVVFRRMRAHRRQALAELEAAQHDLEAFTMQFKEKSELADNLRLEMEKLNANGEKSQYLEQLTNSTILTESDWLKFKSVFEKVYPDFISEQKAQSPNLTQAELRYLVLEKLQLSTRDMANILGVSDGTIRQTRLRLRRKIGEERS